jgi:hypothetical protein
MKGGSGKKKILSHLPGIEQPFLGLPARKSVAAVNEISIFRGEKAN